MAAMLLGLACNGAPHQVDAHPQSDPPPEFHPHPEIAPDELPSPAGTAQPEPICGPPVMPPLKATLRSGPPLTNRIPPEVVMRPVRARWQCYRACAADAQRRDPSVHGTVVTQFVVDLDGWVRSSHLVSNTTGDGALGDCIAHQFVGLKLPDPNGARITIVYPMTVESGSR